MKYAQINKDGIVIAFNYTDSKEVPENLIPIPVDFDGKNKKWDGKKWVAYTPPAPEIPTPQPPEPPPKDATLEAVQELGKKIDGLSAAFSNFAKLFSGSEGK